MGGGGGNEGQQHSGMDVRGLVGGIVGGEWWGNVCIHFLSLWLPCSIRIQWERWKAGGCRIATGDRCFGGIGGGKLMSQGGDESAKKGDKRVGGCI